MDLSITTTSEYALQLLNQYRQGSVHSVYRKTINLSLEGQLMALQTAGSPLSPISLISSLTEKEMASLPVTVGDSVTVTSDSIQIGQYCRILFRQAAPQDLRLGDALTPEQLALLSERLSFLFSHYTVGSFELLFSDPERASQIPFLAIAKEHLDYASQALKASHWEEAALRLCRLIGLGLGLTPGGDDFLCGILAALILSDNARHPFAHALRTHITEHLADTNDISAAFLRCALEGQFSQAVNSLRLLPSVKQMLISFSAIGHSSGTDTLCGIAFFLRNCPLAK